jgi:hypothetical protein
LHVTTIKIVTPSGSVGAGITTSGGVTTGGDVPIITGDGNTGAKRFFFESVETVGSSGDTVAAETADKLKAEKMAAAQDMEKVAAEGEARIQLQNMIDGTPFAAGTAVFRSGTMASVKKEGLGPQVLEGVPAEGVRSTSTFDTGAVGNDRPIHVVSERWVSSDLQTLMMTKHSDPRTGEEVFRLTNVNRSNPDPTLFQLPPGYTLAEEKGRK